MYSCTGCTNTVTELLIICDLVFEYFIIKARTTKYVPHQDTMSYTKLKGKSQKSANFF